MKTPVDGTAASIWKLNIPPQTPAQEASLGAYLIKSKGRIFHLLWDRWQLTVIHLRDLPGIKSAVKNFPEATHEIVVASIDPDTPPIDTDNPTNVRWLQPIDQMVQFEVPNDASALSLAEKLLQLITRGELSPDSDYRSAWQHLITGTAEHYRGEHGTPTDVT